MAVELPPIDWKAQLEGDWKDLAGNAAVTAGIDPSKLTAALPVPSSAELAALGTAIESVAGLLDGEISPALRAQIGQTLGGVAGALVAGTVIGSVVPGLGNAVGLVVGILVGAVFNALFGAGERAAREAAIRKAKSDTWDAVMAWEEKSYGSAWRALMAVTAYGTPSEDRIYAAIERFDRGQNRSDDDNEARPFALKTRAMLKAWGWQPEGKPDGWGAYKGSRYSWEAAGAKWDRPLKLNSELPDPRVTFGAKYGRWRGGRYHWSNEAPSSDERFAAWQGVVENRLEFEKKILQRWNAYILQLGAMRTAIAKAIDAGVVKDRAGLSFVNFRRYGFTLTTTLAPGVGGFTRGLAAGGLALRPILSGRALGLPRAKSNAGAVVGWVLGLGAAGGLGWFLWRNRRRLARRARA